MDGRTDGRIDTDWRIVGLMDWLTVCLVSKEAFVFPESIKEDEWMKAVKESLHPAAQYALVRHIRLVGMLLIVYAR